MVDGNILPAGAVSHPFKDQPVFMDAAGIRPGTGRAESDITV